MREVVRGDQTQPEKICKWQRTNQYTVRGGNWFVRCNLQIFSGCGCPLEQLHAQSSFLFPIVFGIINKFLYAASCLELGSPMGAFCTRVIRKYWKKIILAKLYHRSISIPPWQFFYYLLPTAPIPATTAGSRVAVLVSGPLGGLLVILGCVVFAFIHIKKTRSKSIFHLHCFLVLRLKMI